MKIKKQLYLIEILHQTTTWLQIISICRKLYLIEILHQTTTDGAVRVSLYSCILSKFYIKPQLARSLVFICCRCILSKFYIKPQLEDAPAYVSRVVSYRNSTSNHNASHMMLFALLLYLIEILHQTTTSLLVILLRLRCILSKFYIKPQRRLFWSCSWRSCILSKFYIKPQHFDFEKRINYSCILSKFYIKPQPSGRVRELLKVVSYRNSTSNHNHPETGNEPRLVVSYRNSTSNHNHIAK